MELQNNIAEIVKEINLENGSNYKISVLNKYKDNLLLKKVLKMTYDRVDFTYGVSIKNCDKRLLSESSTEIEERISLEDALHYLETFLNTRQHTGHEALDYVNRYRKALNEDEREIFEKILKRDLRINIGRAQINKVFKDLIVKPAYMRCGTFDTKTSKNINFPAYIQLKADGTYREFTVHNDVVTARSRSGESYDYPILFEKMKNLQDGIYVCELTVDGIPDRALGNGLINSDNPPHEDIIAEFWDYITPEEYSIARKKDKKNPCLTPYVDRFKELNNILEKSLFDKDDKNIKIIETYIVKDINEALTKTSEWMNNGYEGSILKDFNGVFKDGTSKHQLKLKLKISAEMRCTGYQEGAKGTKREGKIGSLIFENDEGTIKGKCSGFSDKQLDEFTKNFDSYKGKILEVEFNDLSKAQNSKTYALSHPRFIEWRNDKDETDTLEKVQKQKEMAMSINV